MTELEFDLVHNASQTFVYVFEQKQIFTKNGEDIYLCKNRKSKCKCRVIIMNYNCYMKSKVGHNHTNTYEKQYEKLIFLSEIEKILLRNMKNNTLLSSRKIFNSIPNIFNIDYDSVRRTIQRRQRQMYISRYHREKHNHLKITTIGPDRKKFVRIFFRQAPRKFLEILQTL